MELRPEEDAWTQRLSPIRRSKPSRNQHKTAANNILEAAGQDGRGGCTRFKFVVRREDLKQVLETIRDGRSRSASAASALATSLEQRLNILRRRQILRGASHGKDRSWKSWSPALQSIPEE